MLAGVDHIRHTHDLERNAFSIGQPEHAPSWRRTWSAWWRCTNASTIAAVNRRAGPGRPACWCAQGYLNKLREICDKHGILLIFDEVITVSAAPATRLRRRPSVSRPT